MELGVRHFESRSRHVPIADKNPDETYTAHDLSGCLGVPAATRERLQNDGLGPPGGADPSGIPHYRKGDVTAWLDKHAAQLEAAVKAAPRVQGGLAPDVRSQAKRLGFARFRRASGQCRGLIVRGSERTRRGRIQAFITASRDADLTELCVARPNALLR
jgi:hypothetical protein